jgi:hypothetical protein
LRIRRWNSHSPRITDRSGTTWTARRLRGP